jgi:trimethylamine--corrinoid protein Co-methyltransferase
MNVSNSITFESPQFSLLSKTHLQDLHFAALEVLRRTGIRFHHREALNLLKKVGAVVRNDNLVKFPAQLVEDAIASVPSRVVMCNRKGEPSMFLEGCNVYFGTGSDCLNVLDPENGEHRKFIQADLIKGYHLCDSLANIDFVMSIGIPSDVDSSVSYDTQMALMLEHTTKPIVFVTNDRASCQRAIDMAAAVAGSYDVLVEEQRILLYSEPTSPLQQSETAVEKLLLMAEYGLPVLHSPGTQMGATAPITMAGGLVMSLAEILSSLVLHQAKRRGAPFVFGAGIHHMDMSAMQICYASPEFQLTKAAVAQLGQWYGMPTWGYAGCSDAKVMDEQAALEAMLSVIMAKLSGANLVHDVGYMESGLTTSFEMIVLTDELVGMTDHLMKGIRVRSDTMMVDEVDSVGPGGQFLGTEETLRRFRDFWFSSLLDRRTRPEWLEAGATTLGQRLKARVEEISRDYQPEPLKAGEKAKIQEILVSAARKS